jgi:zinc transport system permease protein
VDTLVGILFTASLAIGILTIPDTEMFESLFGALPSMSPTVLSLVIGSALLMLTSTLLLARRFLYTVVSEDLARIAGVGRGYELALLVIFSIIVGLGIKLVGTLLMGALTIIPAAAARNVTGSMKSYLLIAIAFGILISVTGVLAAAHWRLPPGPVIILCGVALFMLSLPGAWLRRQR